MPSRDPDAEADPARPDRARQPIDELAAELRIMRDKSHQSLRELQHATFVSDSSLSRYLSGQTVPPWQVVEALCRLVERDPSELRGAWEGAQRARVARSRSIRRIHAVEVGESGDPNRIPTTSHAIPLRDIRNRDAFAATTSRADTSSTRIVRRLGTAAAFSMVAVFIWRRVAILRKRRMR